MTNSLGYYKDGIWHTISGGPVISSSPLAFLKRTNNSIGSSSGTLTTIDFDPANGLVSAAVDPSGIITLGASGGINGIFINEPGQYILAVAAQAQTTGSPAAGSVIGTFHSLDNSDIIAGQYYSPWYAVPGSSAKNFDTVLTELVNVDPANFTIPLFTSGKVTQNSTLSLTVIVSLIIWRVTDWSSPDFF